MSTVDERDRLAGPREQGRRSPREYDAKQHLLRAPPQTWGSTHLPPLPEATCLLHRPEVLNTARCKLYGVALWSADGIRLNGRSRHYPSLGDVDGRC